MSEPEQTPRRLPVYDLRQRYQLHHTLGTGSFGDVHAAYALFKPESLAAQNMRPAGNWRSIPSMHQVGNSRSMVEPRSAVEPRSVAKLRPIVAIKMLRNTSEKEVHFRLREVTFFRKVPSHRNLVKLHEMFQDSESQNVVFSLEHMDGSLYEFMKDHKIAHQGRGLHPLRIAAIMRDIANGLWHIHTHGFVHRDLKPENILYHQSSSGNMIVKLGDFGLSRKLDVWGQPSSAWTSYVATRWYRAPEQLLGMPEHTESLDMFAFGLILYEVCNMIPLAPGSNTEEMIRKLVKQLGMPGKNSLGGSCEAMEYIIRQRFPLVADMLNGRGLLMMAFKGHDMFLPALQGVLQWNPNNRDDAQWTVTRFNGLIERLTRKKRLPHQPPYGSLQGSF